MALFNLKGIYGFFQELDRINACIDDGSSQEERKVIPLLSQIRKLFLKHGYGLTYL
jgi:hypothetical protein